jgi:putative hemolysin
MDDYWLYLALVGVLILLNGLFSGSEIALISLRESQLRRLERRGGAGARALSRLTRNPNRFLASVQIGITLVGFLASATAAVSLAQPLVPVLGFLGAAASATAIALVTLLLTFLTLVFGELAPKRLAMQHATRWALLAARPLNTLAVITRPAVWALGKATDIAVRAFGGSPDAGSEPLTDEELRDLVAGHRGLNSEQRTIISGALDIRERRLREVLVPRRAVFTLPADTPIPKASHLLAASGHSRAPVVTTGTAGLDQAIGVVRLRDLVGEEGAIRQAARPAVVFPDVMRVSDALLRFKAEHEQFALVADEQGAIEGIVTLEDLLEEIRRRDLRRDRP